MTPRWISTATAPATAAVAAVALQLQSNGVPEAMSSYEGLTAVAHLLNCSNGRPHKAIKGLIRP